MNTQTDFERDEELTMNELFSTGQIRLASLSVCNWGSFAGIHTANVHKDGTLITGDNGSGKSTFVDALMVLLQPAGRANFNVAASQGDNSGRSLISYMRGHYGVEHDGAQTKTKSKREGAALSGISALYQGDDGSHITLAALFWTTKMTSAMADVGRLYVVAIGKLSLEDMIANFKDGSPRSLKQWLSMNQNVICQTDSFKDYSAAYQKTLYMENVNAPNLLGRALGLKKIDDLTAIIRELVLEPSTVRDEAREVVSEFQDLVAIHNEVVDAREQLTHLSPLVEINATLTTDSDDLKKQEAQYKSLPTYLYKQSKTLYIAREKAIDDDLKALNSQFAEVVQQEKDAESLSTSRHLDYVKAGGDRVEVIDNQIAYAQQELTRTSSEASKYQERAIKLGLPDELTRSIFDNNLLQAKAGFEAASQKSEQSSIEFGALATQLSDQQNQRNKTEEEVESIRSRPNSNMDVRYQRCRDEMVEALSLNPEQCMFVAELLEVKQEEFEWQGAIERALGSRKMTLIVPEHNRHLVIKWLNDRHLGLNFFVQAAGQAPSGMANFKDDGFLRKLNWRDHVYRDWLKHYLSGSDLHCVEDAMAANNTPYSMTKQGLVNLGGNAFSKRDLYKINDRSNWFLGFSNHARLALLENDLKLLDAEIDKTNDDLKASRVVMQQDKDSETLWREISAFEWDNIKAPHWNERVAAFKKEKADIEDSKGDLAKAKERWDEAEVALKAVRAVKGELQVQSGSLNNRLAAVKARIEKVTTLAEGEIDDEVVAELEQLVKPIGEDDLDNLSQILSGYSSQFERDFEELRDRISKYEKRAIRIMSTFSDREKWSHHAADWSAEIESMGDYLAHHDEILKNGLPALESRFKERLNKHTTQSLAKIKQRLQSERDDIIERIEVITDVLKRTEFRTGTVLELATRPEKFAHVDDFSKKITTCLSLATSDDHDARFAQLTEVMDILAKACDPSTCHTLESLRLLDPRYQMTFYADEKDKVTRENVDVWSSSQEKSGGEMESFAGAIVAASLAYVLTPDGYHTPIYSTVFLDEAFSNTSEIVSRRILKIFKDLKIHVNLITPYKNINLARESASAILLVERDGQKHESSFIDMTWKQIDAILAEQKKKQLPDEASELEIEVGVE